MKAPPPVQNQQPGQAQAPAKAPPPPQEPKPREKPKPVAFKDKDAPTDEEILSQDVFRIDDWVEERRAEDAEKKEAPRPRKEGEVSGVDLAEEFRAWGESRPEEPGKVTIAQFREIRVPGEDRPAPGDAFEEVCGNHVRMAVDEQGRV